MDLVEHYGRDGSAYDTIVAALTAAGITPVDGAVPPEAISGADEFHLGGAPATAAAIDALGVGRGGRVLDVGSGVGGPARSIARLTGAAVTGVDLTPAFVATAARLSRLVGMDDVTTFRIGDAGRIGDGDATYDGATMFHVGAQSQMLEKAGGGAGLRKEAFARLAKGETARQIFEGPSAED